MSKVLKFTPYLANLIRLGKKTTTFRLFDDKNLNLGDKLILAEKDNFEVKNFAKAEITEIFYKTLETLDFNDFIGHEPVENLLEYYSNFYGEKVNWQSEVKVIRFRILKFNL